MITSCLGVVVKRGLLLLALTGFLPIPIGAQVDSAASSTDFPRRQNAWVSAGIGIGKGGVAGAASAWYSNNRLVVGAHAADVSQLWGTDVHEVALMVGVRDLGPRGLVMIAAGPAKFGGQLYAGDPYPRSVRRDEIGITVAMETILTLPVVGIGFDAFFARSQTRLVEGVTLSLQVGWFGN